jgi:flagellar protein FliS
MSVQRTAFQAYNQAMHTVGKTRQVVMLYDGAIRYMQQAKQAIEAGQIEERYKLLLRVSEILMGLQSALDFENGGNVARVLYDFYSNLDARLTKIQRNNSLALCDEVVDELKQMRGVWNEIDEKNTASQTQAASSMPSTEAPEQTSINTPPQPENFLPSDFSA